MYLVKITEASGSTTWPENVCIGLATLASVLVFLRKEKPKLVEVFKNGQTMKVVRNSYGEYGVQQDGNVADLLLEMVDEVDFYYVRKGGIKAPQPHEMMPDEWKAVSAVGSAAYGVFPCFTEEQRRQSCDYVDSLGRPATGDVTYLMMSVFNSRFGYGHNGPYYDSDKNTNSRHEVHVAYALANGKNVPEEVLNWYKAHPKEVESVGKWFALLLEWPEYRGKMTEKKLLALVSLCRGDEITLTNENAGFFIRLMSELPDDVTWTGIDDFLYGKGILKVRAKTFATEPCDLSQAYSPFALKLRTMLAEHRKEAAIERAHEQRTKYHNSLRELHSDLAQAENLHSIEGLRYPNLFAEAIDKKDIGVLLTYLDSSADSNQATKHAVKEVYGLNVNGLNAADRRSAVFAFCGYDSQMRAKYEKDQADKKAASQRAQDAKFAKQKVEDSMIRFDGEVITVAAYVDRAVANGHTEITTSKKGAATQYWLSNPATGSSISVQRKDGSLEYAKLVHGLTEHRQAA